MNLSALIRLHEDRKKGNLEQLYQVGRWVEDESLMKGVALKMVFEGVHSRLLLI